MPSNYVCAGFESLVKILNKFIICDEFDNHWDLPTLQKFFENTCPRLLHSFGQNFKLKKKFQKHKQVEIETFEKARDLGYFGKSELWVDSGGFQISVGLLDRWHSEGLFEIYHEFLVERPELYDKAFILDVPPGPGCTMIKNFQDVYDLNYKSYSFAANLPKPIRDKMIYIHHFRTPKLWEIYDRLLNENNMFDKFNNFATGGIIANMKSDVIVPIIIYILPLIVLLNKCIEAGKKELNFHVLGGASFRDILFYELFRIHVEKVHGIKLNLTYDSSGIFKALMVARVFLVKDNNIIRKMSVRTDDLNFRLNDGTTALEKVREMIDNMSIRHNLKRIPIEHIYCNTSGTFTQEVRAYSALYNLDMYDIMQTQMRNVAERIYPMYDAGDFESFNMEAFEVTRDINQGKITKKQRSKTNSIVQSLNMLTQLDTNHCKYIVDTFLARDEFTDLCPTSSYMSI